MPLALPYHTCIRDKMSDALYHPLEKLSFNKLPHPPPASSLSDQQVSFFLNPTP